MTGYSVWGTFLALRADEIGANAGAIFLAWSAIVLVLRLFGARLPERLGLVRCVAAAVTAMGGGLGLLWALGSVAGLWAGSLLIGLGIALLYPALLTVTINRTPETARGEVVSTFSMFFEVGGAMGGVLGGAVARTFGYRGAFGIGAVVALTALIPLSRLRTPAEGLTPG